MRVFPVKTVFSMFSADSQVDFSLILCYNVRQHSQRAIITMKQKNRLVYVLLALLFGFLGVHCYYAGNKIKALILFILGVFTVLLAVLAVCSLGSSAISFSFSGRRWMRLRGRRIRKRFRCWMLNRLCGLESVLQDTLLCR